MKIRLIILLPLFMLPACSHKMAPQTLEQLEQPKNSQKYLASEPNSLS